MNIDSIQNGFVIDHITAGRAMRLFELLGLEELKCSVAIIKNVNSRKLGKKDIIKIDEATGSCCCIRSFILVRFLIIASVTTLATAAFK